MAVVLLSASVQQTKSQSEMEQMVRQIPGLSTAEQNELIAALTREFKAEIRSNALKPGNLEIVSHMVNAGLFEEMKSADIASSAHKAFIAAKNGANAEYVEEMAYSGFSTQLESAQIEVSAKILERYEKSGIDPVIYQEVVSHGLTHEWPDETVNGVYDALVRGKELGADMRKLALALIIRIDQGLGGVPIEAAARDEIGLLTGGRQARSEESGRDFAFEAMQKAIEKNVNRDIAYELYYHAVGDKWSEELVKAVFNGMIKAREIGLSEDKVALAMLIRIEQGMGGTSPSTMVKEEIAFIANLEKKRVDLVENDPVLDYTKPVPEPYREPVYVPPQEPEPGEEPPVRPEPEPEPEPRIYQQNPRSAINLPLMAQVIQDYLGTPYRYGGMSRYGIDCSGFTTVVYREQGIFLPRMVREQCQIGRDSGKDQLRYGDLLFFNRWGSGEPSHVGIYVGDGRFAHASSSLGVTISELTKKYYQIRFVLAKRVV